MLHSFDTIKKIAAQAGLTAKNANFTCISSFLSLFALGLLLVLPAGAIAQVESAPCALTAPADQPALLYVWSPRMVLSVEHAGAVRGLARSLGLHWQPVHDPAIAAAELQAALESQMHGARRANYHALKDSQALCNADLIDQQHALRHFPTAYVLYSQDDEVRIAGEAIVGAMPLAFWRLALQQRLELAKVTHKR